MGFECRYPVGLSTYQWLPSSDPAVEDSNQEHDDGMLADVTADRYTMYVQKTRNAVIEYTYAFIGLTPADKTAFETFQAAVKGDAFEFRDDPTCGPVTSFTKVKFAPQAFERDWIVGAGQTWAVTLIFREVI